MAKAQWNDEYWPLLIQLYQKKPEGVKPLYSRGLVEISLNLHIEPQVLHRKMQELRTLRTPYLKHQWEDFANNPRRLSKAVKNIQQKQGYGTSGKYFDGIEINETFEKDFKPLEVDSNITPIKLICILNLYFQLTPTTMVTDTDEIIELGKLIRMPARQIVEIMDIFKFCDPYLNKADIMIHPLLFDCQNIWNRYGNDDTEKLAALVAQLKEYFK